MSEALIGGAPSRSTASGPPRHSWRPRVVATDLDGTLLRRDGSVSDRTHRALAALPAAGLLHVLVSGRPPRTLRLIAERIGATGLAICCNGALVLDLADGAIAHHLPMTADLARGLVGALRERAPGVCFAVERGLEYGAEPDYLALRPPPRHPVTWQDDALALCAGPLTKLIAYHGTLTVEELRQIAVAHAGETATVTYSGAGFLEIAAAGVDKATALRWLCERRGHGPADVIAFGDMLNDLAMLRWAGHSVAVANGHPEVLAAVHEVTLSNDEDGVAVVLERLLNPAADR